MALQSADGGQNNRVPNSKIQSFKTGELLFEIATNTSKGWYSFLETQEKLTKLKKY